MPSFLSPLLRDSTPFTLRNTRNDRTIADRLLTAFDSASRRRGLLGRTSLPHDTALVIAPSNAVHTFFMQFHIDIALVARDGRVLKICAAVPPRRIAVALRAYAVIELAAGALARSETKPGDTLEVFRRSE